MLKNNYCVSFNKGKIKIATKEEVEKIEEIIEKFEKEKLIKGGKYGKLEK